MEYTKINNPDDVANQSLASTAVEKEEVAFSTEMSAAEAEVRAKNGDSTIDVKGSRQAAAVARREADAYVKAAKLPDEEVKEVRLRFLHRWVEGLERMHIHHKAILEVKASLGEPSASADSVLSGLELVHEFATSKLAELEGKKATKAAPKKSMTRQAKS